MSKGFKDINADNKNKWSLGRDQHADHASYQVVCPDTFPQMAKRRSREMWAHVGSQVFVQQAFLHM